WARIIRQLFTWWKGRPAAYRYLPPGMNLRSIMYCAVCSINSLGALKALNTALETRCAMSAHVSPSCAYFWFITVLANTDISCDFSFPPKRKVSGAILLASPSTQGRDQTKHQRRRFSCLACTLLGRPCNGLFVLCVDH